MLLPGAVVGGHVIIQRLGAGGMGAVYLARHSRLKRQVALKVLYERYASDVKARLAFDQEAEIAASLHHPNLITIYDRNDGLDPYLWLSMTHVPGGDANGLLLSSPGGLDLTDVAKLIADVADALAHAHQRGFLHRDVKPANILIDNTDGRRHAVLADFGIARVAEATITASGVTGTLAYIAPERLSRSYVDQRIDVYSLGCTLFQLLTGRLPFTARDPAALIAAHLTTPPPSLRQYRPDLPIELDTVVKTALAKDPDARYRSCIDLAQATRETLSAGTYTYSWTSDTSATGVLPTNEQDVHRAIVEIYELGRERAQNGDAEGAENSLRQAATHGLPAAMCDLGNLLANKGNTQAALVWLRRAAETGDPRSMFNYALELNNSGALEQAEQWYRHAASQGIGQAMFNLGNLKSEHSPDEAVRWYRDSIDNGYIGALRNLGKLLANNSNDIPAAEQCFRDAIDHGNTTAMLDLAQLLADQNRLSEAEDWYRHAIAVGHDEALNNLGVVLANRGAVEEAEACYRRASADGNPLAMYNLAAMLHRRNSEEAKQWYDHAAERGDADAMYELGRWSEMEGDLDNAERNYRRAISAGHTKAIFGLALLLLTMNRFDEADYWRRRAAEKGMIM